METHKYTNLRVLKEDAETLKIEAALRRESMLQTFHHLVQQEHQRLLSSQEAGKTPDAPLHTQEQA